MSGDATDPHEEGAEGQPAEGPTTRAHNPKPRPRVALLGGDDALAATIEGLCGTCPAFPTPQPGGRA